MEGLGRLAHAVPLWDLSAEVRGNRVLSIPRRGVDPARVRVRVPLRSHNIVGAVAILHHDGPGWPQRCSVRQRECGTRSRPEHHPTRQPKQRDAHPVVIPQRPSCAQDACNEPDAGRDSQEGRHNVHARYRGNADAGCDHDTPHAARVLPTTTPHTRTRSHRIILMPRPNRRHSPSCAGATPRPLALLPPAAACRMENGREPLDRRSCCIPNAASTLLCGLRQPNVCGACVRLRDPFVDFRCEETIMVLETHEHRYPRRQDTRPGHSC